MKKYSQTQTSAKYMLQDPAVGNSFPESQEKFQAGVWMCKYTVHSRH